MQQPDFGNLDPRRTWWVPAVVAPERDWAGAPGCRRGARFLVDADSLRPTRDHYPAFESRSNCLEWIMAHRSGIVRSLPGAQVKPANLARWMLGLE